MGNLHGVDGPPSWKLKAAASISLSALFMVVYSGANWFTSLRSDIGTWHYEWEHWIPFIPLMVIPYMSIDLFFASAPFLIRERRELAVFSRRITAAILIAGVCFVLFPLRLAVERPPLEGWIGAAFGWFFTMDKPYNLCPSLHIALRTVLANTYARHTRGLTLIASHVWFSLTGFSTLFTYQHHVVDVIGGFILAAICFYMVPAWRHPSPVVPNRRVGIHYAVLAALAIGLFSLDSP